MSELLEKVTPGTWTPIHGEDGLVWWIDGPREEFSGAAIGFCEADAHLMAASKELYEALQEHLTVVKACFNFINENVPGYLMHKFATCMAMFEVKDGFGVRGMEALAKAQGPTPPQNPTLTPRFPNED